MTPRRRIIYTLAQLVITAVFILPQMSMAQSRTPTCIGDECLNWDEPVPVPHNTSFADSTRCSSVGKFLLLCGPAGQSTATGLILGVINLLLALTAVLTVLFVVIGGIRYLTAHGNEEAAEGAKKTLQHAVVGLAIVILSFVIIRVIANALIYSEI